MSSAGSGGLGFLEKESFPWTNYTFPQRTHEFGGLRIHKAGLKVGPPDPFSNLRKVRSPTIYFQTPDQPPRAEVTSI